MWVRSPNLRSELAGERATDSDTDRIDVMSNRI